MQEFSNIENYRIELAEEPDQIAACLAVISQLRPYLTDMSVWMDRAASLISGGYKILAVWEKDVVVAMAGFRFSDNMIYGKFLYVDDLITDMRKRGSGLGAMLLNELQSCGRAEGCGYLVLDTAATNIEARRFYEREGLKNLALGYLKPLTDQSAKYLEQYTIKE